VISVRAVYFAAFREQAGCENEDVSTSRSTAGELYAELSERHGFLDPTGRCKVAINDELADWDDLLADGDVVLFFPPVAGG
jgi:molybdopterin converting factor subunit 1